MSLKQPTNKLKKRGVHIHTLMKEDMQTTLLNKTTTEDGRMKVGTEDSMRSKIALVTGASSGIGKATAERLAIAGYKVYGTSRRGALASAQSFEMLSLDVTSDESVEAAVTELMRREGRIDLLVNNAGFSVAPAGAEESQSNKPVRFLRLTSSGSFG